MNLVALEQLCFRIIAAASSPQAGAAWTSFTFPHGACSWACEAGGEVLTEYGFGSWSIWNASETGFGSLAHSWLVHADDHDLFVDLTAHQFPGPPPRHVGRGPNPLAERFAFRQRLLPACIPPKSPEKVAWLDTIRDLLAHDIDLGARDDR